MSKTPVKKAAAKKSVKTVSKKPVSKVAKAPVKSTTKSVVASKPHKSTASANSDVKVNKNVLFFLVLTLVLAAVVLLIQAQTNKTLSEQNKATQALDYETESKQNTYENQKQ